MFSIRENFWNALRFLSGADVLFVYLGMKMFEHLKDHDLSYRDHQRLAFLVARDALKVSVMAFLHGLLPSLYVRSATASGTLKAIMPRYEALESELRAKAIRP